MLIPISIPVPIPEGVGGDWLRQKSAKKKNFQFLKFFKYIFYG
jgi:hypothetical protein